MGTMEFTVFCTSAEQMAEIYDSLSDEPTSSSERAIIKGFFDWVNSADPADVAAMLVASTKPNPLYELCCFVDDYSATPATAAAIVGIMIAKRLCKDGNSMAASWFLQAAEIIGADYPDGIVRFLDGLPRGSLGTLLVDLTHFHQQLLEFLYDLSKLENDHSHIPPLAKYLSPATIAELLISVMSGVTPFGQNLLDTLFGKAGPCEEDEDIRDARLKAMVAVSMLDTLGGGNSNANAFLNRLYADEALRPRIGELASTANIVLWIYQSELQYGNYTIAELPELVKEIKLDPMDAVSVIHRVTILADK